MNRRGFFQRLSSIPIFSLLWLRLTRSMRAATGPASSSARRVRPSDPSWPTAKNWEKLNQEVGGRLVKVQSPLAACESLPDSTPCQEVLGNLQNPYYIGDQAGATQTIGWLDGWTSVPSAFAVAVRSTSDVVAAVNFARENNLRLVVKGGGHSYQGTSAAADSLLVWTRGMNRITLHDSFIGQGCAENQPPHEAVTVEAGAMWIDVYHAVTTVAGRYVQGGGCATVGVAGLILSGGFGSFSKNYGMAAAALLEAEIVTADGSARTTNASTDPDLFWAIKGGGGGSLGVVTRITLKTSELPAHFGGVRATIRAASDAAFRGLIGQFISFYRDALFNPHWGESVTLGADNTLAITMVFQGLDKKQASDVWQPFFDWVAKSPQDLTFEAKPEIGAMPAQNWWDAEYRRKNSPHSVITDPRPGTPETHVWWASNQSEVGIFVHGYKSSWLPAPLLEKDQQKRLAEALFASSRSWNVGLHFNKGLAGAPPEAVMAARETATNPAVLDSFALAIIAGGSQSVYPGIRGHEPDLAVARKNADQIEKSTEELRKIIPGCGSYLSESDFFERSWQRSFWGTNYPRLLAVKEKYDPAGLFFVHHGVGAEVWSADGFTRLTES